MFKHTVFANTLTLMIDNSKPDIERALEQIAYDATEKEKDEH